MERLQDLGAPRSARLQTDEVWAQAFCLLLILNVTF